MLIDPIQNPERVEIRYRDGRSEMVFNQPVPHNMRYEITASCSTPSRASSPEEDLRRAWTPWPPSTPSASGRASASRRTRAEPWIKRA